MSDIHWHTEKRKVKDLVPADYNPRRITEKERDDLKKSIEEFGIVGPLVLNIGNKIIGGHQRATIYADLNIDEIEVVLPDRKLTIESKGYVRKWATGLDGKYRMRMVHDLVWEKRFGPIPQGMQVHHKNHNKRDNRIQNLELVDALTHKRIHSGCKLIDGIWWKHCRRCLKIKRADADFYKHAKSGVQSICKQCQSAASVKNKKIRRAKNVNEKI